MRNAILRHHIRPRPGKVSSSSDDCSISFGASPAIHLAACRIREYLDLCSSFRLIGVVTEAIDATASLLSELGDHEAGALLFGAAKRLNEETGNPSTFPERPIYDAARLPVPRSGQNAISNSIAKESFLPSNLRSP